MVLTGDFSAGVILSAANLTNIETLRFAAGHDYTLTVADGLVPTGIQLDVRGDVGPFVGGVFLPGLGVGDSLSFDGSAETHGSFYLHGGQGDDTLIGSAQADAFDLSQGGSDIATGGNSNDVFYAGGGLNATDQINGGSGFDYIYMETNAGVNITFGVNSLVGLELIQCAPHFGGGAFAFVMNDGNVASGATLEINGASLNAGTETFSVNASAETDGHYKIVGGVANDALIGGALSDTLTGGGGADALTGGGGADSFVFASASESSSTNYDTITDLNANLDKIDSAVVVSVFDGITNGSVSTASFDADVAAAVDSVLGAGHACRLQADAGTLSSHNFLVIDGNNNGTYEAGLDYVIDITGFSGTITAGLFV